MPSLADCLDIHEFVAADRKDIMGILADIKADPDNAGLSDQRSAIKAVQQYIKQMEAERDAILGQIGTPKAEAMAPAPVKALSADYGAKNKVFSKEAADKAREILRKKLLNQVNIGLDPEIVKTGIELAGYHIEAGARKFIDFAKAMINDISDVVKPYLRQWYEMVRYEPGFDATGMSTIEEIENDLKLLDEESKLREKEESENATTIDNGSEAAKPVEDDRGGTKGERTRDVSGDEEASSPEDVSGGERQGTDGSILSGGTKAPGAGNEEQRTNGTESATGNEPTSSLERDTGKSPRLPRSPKSRGYRISAGELTRQGSWAKAADNNLDAIELVKKIEQENRPATDEEKAVLVKYVGWGASELANNMFPAFAQTGEVNPEWGNKAEWKPRVERLVSLLTPEEIKTAAKSTQYAHYTSEPIIRSIYKALQRFGFKGGKFLEPGSGIGHFVGLMPDNIAANTIFTGIEMDGISAKIGKALYPNHNMMHEDFTQVKLPDDFFDGSVGNPPFRRSPVLHDKRYANKKFSLHNYFMAKTMDKIKPGGAMVFVVTHYAMDAKQDRMRQYLSERADLIGAIRLPETAFQKNAGTEVVTDVLFLRKRFAGEPAAGQPWLNLAEVQTAQGPTMVNEYFAAHPEMVLGRHSLKGSMYAKDSYTVEPMDGTIEELFDKAVEALPESSLASVTSPPAQQRQATIERDFNPTNRKEGGLYTTESGELMVVESGSGVPLTSVKKLKPKDKAWLKGYVKLRDALKQAHYDQLNDLDWEKSLKVLQREYNKFVKENGQILTYTLVDKKETNEDGEEEVVEQRRYKNMRLLRMDAEWTMVSSLEKITDEGEIIKGPFLIGRALNRPTEPSIASIHDAVAVTLNQVGSFDLDHAAKLANVSNEQAIEQLGDMIYLPPDSDKWILRDEYLSGNVVKKLEEAKNAAAVDPKYQRNVDALTKVIPSPLTSEQITVTLGANWMPIEYYNDFAEEVLGLNHFEITYDPRDNTWMVRPEIEEAPSWHRRRSRKPKVQDLRGSNSEWSTPQRGTNEILSYVLNSQQIKIVVRDVDGKQYTDTAATAAANEVAKNMKERFRTWIWEDAARTSDILNIYNTTMNDIADRSFNGDHLTLPGVSLRFPLHAHQKRAIWRIIQTGNTYLNHAVGAGKTIEMIAAGMEMRRLGLIKKPLYIVPNHMLEQFANEFQMLYPTAHIMVADEVNFHTDNRRRFVAQATLNNPDAVILTHSSFGLLKVHRGTAQPVMDQFLRDMRESLDDLRGEGAARHRIKQMEDRMEAAESRFLSLSTDDAKDTAVSFEDMGVDFLFVDEAHKFRKLDFITNRTTKGIDPNGSRMAIDLFIKTRYLQGLNPGRSHVFASGTPIVNTLGEMYSIMRYFSEEIMKADGMEYFDAWANMFGVSSIYSEPNAAGKYELVERFAPFVNVPEMMNRVRMFMDVLTRSQLAIKIDTLPEIAGGQPEIVIAPPTQEMKDYQNNVLQPRIDASKEWKPSPGQRGNPDPIVNIITDGRLASLDMRYVDNTQPPNPNSKLNVMIDGIIEGYNGTKENTYINPETKEVEPIKGGAQIVFFNTGLGEMVATKRGFNGRAWMMKRFKEAGIPAAEVAWIDDYASGAQKEAVYKEIRQGKRRILIGSAERMGTGVNVQKRLTHLHYLDPPWYPANVEQPDGRIIRQGNQNKVVRILRYATKASYDSTMWQMVARKSRSIEQAFMGDASVRTIDDISETSKYEMAAALASGDQRVIELAHLKSDVDRLENLKEAHRREQSSLGNDKQWAEFSKSRLEARIKLLRKADEKTEYISNRDVKVIIDEQEYKSDETAGTALISKLQTLFDAHKGKKGTYEAGTFHGYKVTITTKEGGNGADIKLHILDGLAYNLEGSRDDPAGVIKQARSIVNGISRELNKAVDELKETDEKLKDFTKRIGAPFKFAQELVEKTAAVATIEAQLRQENEDIPDANALLDMAKAVEAEKAAEKKALMEANGEFQFYIATNQGPILKKGQKVVIPGYEDFTFYIRKEPEGWVITEAVSGQTVGATVSNTIEETTDKFKTALENRKTPEEFRVFIDSYEPKMPPLPETSARLGSTGVSPAQFAKLKSGLSASIKALQNTLPPELFKRVDTQFKTVIDLSGKNVNRSLREHGYSDIESLGKARAIGSSRVEGFRASVEIAYTDPKTMEGTGYHEAFHVAAKWLLPESDMDILLDTYKNEEGAAEAYAKYVRGTSLSQYPSMVRKIFVALKRILKAIREAFTGKGYRAAEDIFNDLLGQRYSSRGATGTGKGTQLSLAGEIESRDTTAGMKASNEEWEPYSSQDISEEEAIVKYEGEGEPSFSVVPPDYKPKKTVKAYKLFTVKKNQPGKLFPLFIDTQTATPMGQWLTADFIPTEGYAPRPGWHAGHLPIAPHLRKKSTGKIAPMRVWAEVEMPADVDWQKEADKGEKKDIRGKVPTDGYYRFKTSKMQGGAWMIGGAVKINKILSDNEVRDILEKAGIPEDEIKRELKSEPETRASIAPNDDLKRFFDDEEIDDETLEKLKTEQEAYENSFTETAKDVAGTVKGWGVKGFRSIFPEVKSEKPDTTVWDRLLSLPSHYFEKVPALKRMYEAALRRPDNYFKLVTNLLSTVDEGVTINDRLKALRKADKDAYNNLRNYLITRDQNKVGYSVISEDKGKTFKVVNTKGVKFAEAFEDENKAWMRAVTLEGDEYRRESGSELAAKALMDFRLVTHKGFNLLMGNMRKLINEYLRIGKELPVKKVIINGETVEVDLRAALAEMGDLRGFYFPRIREPGKFVLTATKKGANPIMEFYDARPVLAWRARELRKDGYTIGEVEKSKNTPEDVFQMMPQVIAMNEIINQALSRVKTRDGSISLKDVGLEGEWRQKDHLVVSGPLNRLQQDIMFAFGGRRWKQEGNWHFLKADAELEKNIAWAIQFDRGLSGADEMLLLAETITDEVATIIQARGARSRMVERSQAKGKDVWVGYEMDPSRAITKYAKSLAAGDAKHRMAVEMARAFMGTDVSWQEFKSDPEQYGNYGPTYMDYMQFVDERRIDARKQKEAWRDAKVYMEDMLRNDEAIDRILGVLKGLAVLKYLGGRLAAPLVNLTALPTSAIGAMIGEANIPIAKAFKHLGHAMGLYTKYRFNKWQKRDLDITDDIKRALDEITSRGWDSAQFNKEAVATLRSKIGKGYDAVLEYSMLPFGETERLNRGATILGTYLALREGKQGFSEEDLQIAKKVSDLSHGVYGKANRPAIARGTGVFARIPQSFYVFKTFSHNFILTMARYGFKKPEAALFMALMPAILGGAGASLLAPLIKAAAQAGGSDDPEEWFYTQLRDLLGEEGEMLGRYGLAGLAGISIKGSLEIGIGDIPTNLTEILGAPASIGQDIARGFQEYGKGNWLKGMEKLLPNALGAPIRAIRESTEGLTTSGSVPIFHGTDRVTSSTMDAIRRAMSFNPAKIASITEQHYAEKNVEERYSKMRSEIYGRLRRYLLASKEEQTKAGMMEILAMVQEYNERVKEKGLWNVQPITADSLKSAARLAFVPSRKEKLRAAVNQ